MFEAAGACSVLLCNMEDMAMGGMVRYKVKVNEYETKPAIGAVSMSPLTLPDHASSRSCSASLFLDLN